MSQTPESEPIVAEMVVTPPASPLRNLANNTWMLCCTLFLVTGALGLPLIFYNSHLKLSQKLLLSAAVTVYTLVLGGLATAAVMWAWSVISAL